jgi:hypothetical protein
LYGKDGLRLALTSSAHDHRILRSKVATLADQRDAIIAALDFVLTGF